MAHELADDDIYTSALTGAARVWGALSATADEPTSFGREAIINTAKDGLARVATTGSASDLSSGTIPLDRLHAFLQDIANISFSNGDLIYFNGTDLIRLPVGTAAQVLTVVSGVPAWTTQPYVDVEEAVADAQAAAAAAAGSETNAGVSAAEALASASAASAHAANAAAAAGFTFSFSTSTTMSDPGTGNVRFNNSTLDDVTAVAISMLSADAGNPDVGDWIRTWDDSTNTTGKGLLRLRVAASSYVDLRVDSLTDNTTWALLVVEHVESYGTFSGGASVVSAFSRWGDKGADGFGLGDVVGPASSTDSHIVQFDGTTGKLVKSSNLALGAAGSAWAQSFWFNAPSGYTPSEAGYWGNNADADAFFQFRSGVPAGTQRRMYFSWLDTNNNIKWHFGKNSGHSIILFDYGNNTHRMQIDSGGATHLTSGGSDPIWFNWFGEAGTGTGGYRFGSGGASPSDLARITPSGQLSVGHGSPDGSAKLDVESTTQGFLPPRMTTAQRNAISAAADGLVLYDTDLKSLMTRSNSAWRAAVAKQYYCLVNLGGANQSGVSSGVYTKVNLSNEVTDPDGAFDAATNYRYIAPVTGLYYFRGSIGSYNGYKINAYLFVNNANTVAGSEAAASSAGPSIVSTVLQLTAGDYVELFGLQSSGTDAFWGNIPHTNFTAFLIST